MKYKCLFGESPRVVAATTEARGEPASVTASGPRAAKIINRESGNRYFGGHHLNHLAFKCNRLTFLVFIRGNFKTTRVCSNLMLIKIKLPELTIR